MSIVIKHNGADFKTRMAARAKSVEDTVHKRVVDFGTTLVRRLFDDTPKLSGQATANWQATRTSANSYFVELPAARARPVVYDSASVDRAKSAALDTVTGAWVIGSKLIIFNNAPYIVRLNDGYSQKAPAGFVEAAIAAAKGV